MRSRTSFFNGTIFKKNLTRFAPVWGGYLLCLLLGMLLLMDSGTEYWFAANFADLIKLSGVINLCYALVVAQVLFGDLYNTRMCNALHAMPLRRECWFFTNVCSGLFFSILPTAIMVAIASPLNAVVSSMVDGWQLPLYWLLGNHLEFMLFFGVAVFSAFCSGSRVGMAVIYAILNSLSYMAYFLVDTVYVPVLHGVILQSDIFELLCPVSRIVSGTYIDCTQHKEFIGYSRDGYEQYNLYGTFALAEGWGYLWIIAAVGIVLTLVALWMYRRRRLECAGELIATKKLEPAFMVLFSLAAAVVFHFIVSDVMGFSYDEGWSIFLFVGLAVGWFAGRMMLERQVNVFRRGKNWLGMILLAAVFGLTMYVNTLDPFGIVTWVPEAQEVQQVSFGIRYWGQINAEEPEKIADAIRLHELALEEMLTPEKISEERMKHMQEPQTIDRAETPQTIGGSTVSVYLEEEDYRKSCPITISYTLKNGRSVQRDYYLWVDSEAGALLNKYTSSVEGVFPFYNRENAVETTEDLLKMAGEPEYMTVEGVALPKELLTKETVENFFRAVSADCEAGTMTQDADFHQGKVIEEETYSLSHYNVDLRMDYVDCYFSVNIYADSEHCLAWLESLGILDEVKANVASYYK